MADAWTGGQYSIYRALLGGFLIVHFAMLLPYGAEVFAALGVLHSGQLSPLFGVLPNPLQWDDSAWVVTVMLASGLLAGAAVALGRYDRAGALLAALVLAWLYARNPLIANPSLPLLGWLLILHLFVPPRPYGALAARLDDAALPHWRLPRHLWLAAWTVLALSYSYSGYTKLLSESWRAGDAIVLVLNNPLARDHALREWVLLLPDGVWRAVTWGLLAVELLFAPLALFARLRPWLWALMLGAQFGFLIFLNFADLTFPMLIAHLLTFDPRWLDARRPRSTALVLFDGQCAFCHASVRLAAMEDRFHLLKFAPLDGSSAAQALLGVERRWRGDSIVVRSADGQILVKSMAVGAILERLGGLWLLLGRALRWLPRWLADFGYDAIGAIRYRLAGRYPRQQCALLPGAVLARMLP